MMNVHSLGELSRVFEVVGLDQVLYLKQDKDRSEFERIITQSENFFR